LTYPDLPTTSAIYKRDKITLPKAVAKENNRGSITSVQKAGRASERAKKRERVAEEQARENGASENGARGGESGDQVEGRAPKRARVAMGAPRRSGRHV
jgi:hypothetical protein